MTRGVPTSRHSPATSRKASSIDIGSTIGVVSSKIAYTALLASTYASKRAGTSIRFGHRRRASPPGIAARTPKRFAS